VPLSSWLNVNREDNVSGCFKDEKMFSSPSVYHCLCFLSNLQISSSQMIVLSPFFISRYLSHRSTVFPWNQVVLPQFWLPRRDSASSKYGCGVIFHCGASTFLPEITSAASIVVVLAIFTVTTYPVTSHRRFGLCTRSFASFSPTLSLNQPSLCITKQGVFLLNTEEGRVNGLDYA